MLLPCLLQVGLVAWFVRQVGEFGDLLSRLGKTNKTQKNVLVHVAFFIQTQITVVRSAMPKVIDTVRVFLHVAESLFGQPEKEAASTIENLLDCLGDMRNCARFKPIFNYLLQILIFL